MSNLTIHFDRQARLTDNTRNSCLYCSGQLEAELTNPKAMLFP